MILLCCCCSFLPPIILLYIHTNPSGLPHSPVILLWGSLYGSEWGKLAWTGQTSFACRTALVEPFLLKLERALLVSGISLELLRQKEGGACLLVLWQSSDKAVWKLKHRPGSIRLYVSIQVASLNTVFSLQQTTSVLPLFKFPRQGVNFPTFWMLK